MSFLIHHFSDTYKLYHFDDLAKNSQNNVIPLYRVTILPRAKGISMLILHIAMGIEPTMVQC